MKRWIFKLIYYPIWLINIVATGAVLILIIKDAGWNVPFRWMCIIGGTAYIADIFANGDKRGM